MNSFFTGRKLLPVAGLVTAFALSGLIAVSSTASSEVHTFQEIQKQETQVTVPQVAVPDIAQEFGKKRKLRVKSFGKKKAPVIITKVKNLDAEEDDWVRGLEIEVKNVSKRPIYFIMLGIQFPDSQTDKPNVKVGFPVKFGSPRLINLKQTATSSDSSLQPGESYTFKIPKAQVLGIQTMKNYKKLTSETTKNISATFRIINFGDGTGFMGTKYVNTRKKAFAEKARFKKTSFSPPIGGLSFQKVGCSKTPQFASTLSAIAVTLTPPCGSGNCSPYEYKDISVICDGGNDEHGDPVTCEADEVVADTDPDSPIPCAYLDQDLKPCGIYPEGCYDDVIDTDGCPDNTNCPDVDEDGWTECDGDCDDYDACVNPDAPTCVEDGRCTFSTGDANCDGLNDLRECEDRY